MLQKSYFMNAPTYFTLDMLFSNKTYFIKNDFFSGSTLMLVDLFSKIQLSDGAMYVET